MKVIIFSFLMFLSMAAMSQKKKQNTWKVTDAGVSYRLPDNWRSDPFSSSSVCDCPGTINDNGEWDADYLGMVVYTAEYPIKDSADQNRVWSYVFSSNENGEEIVINGITFIRKSGFLSDDDEQNTAWQYVSTNKDKNNRYIIVYFWGLPKKFEQNKSVFLRIMESFESE